MKKHLIGPIGKIIGIFALLTALTAFAELGRPYVYKQLRARDHARICAEIEDLITRHNLRFPSEPFPVGALPDDCVK